MFDISKIVFSARGSYIGIFNEPTHYGNGLWIRSLISPEWGTTGKKKLGTQMLKIILQQKGEFVAFKYEFMPNYLKLYNEFGFIKIVIANTHTVVMTLHNFDVVFEHDYSDLFATDFIIKEQKITALYPICNTKFSIEGKNGELEYDRGTKRIFVKKCKKITVSIKRTDLTYIDNNERSEERLFNDFTSFSENFSQSTEQERLSAYLLWSGTFSPLGNIKRECNPISKYKMNMFFTLANCFIAMALVKADKTLAKDNFLALADHQKENGFIVDAVNPVLKVSWFTKPPVCGFIYAQLIALGIAFTKPEKEKIYELFKNLLDAWLKAANNLKLCRYTHPWDSGMDNATCFDDVLPISTPDLNTFILLLMKALHDLAVELEKESDAIKLKKQQKVYLSNFIQYSWNGNEFTGVSDAGLQIPLTSSSKYIPLLLGDLLSKKMIDLMCKNMLQDGTITQWSIATESIKSIKYETRQGDTFKPGAYWRGPVWGYFVYLIYIGLEINGKTELATKIAESFCKLVEKNAKGIFENYDALTGEGYDDSCDQWTAAIYMLLKVCTNK